MSALRELSRPALLAVADALDRGAPIHEILPAELADRVEAEIAARPHVAWALRELAAERLERQELADRCELVWPAVVKSVQVGLSSVGVPCRIAEELVQERFTFDPERAMFRIIGCELTGAAMVNASKPLFASNENTPLLEITVSQITFALATWLFGKL